MPGIRWSTGAPLPLLVSSEGRTLLAFYRDDRDVGDGKVLVVEFVRCIAVRSGFPNDEVLHGHRLWGKGPDFYELHEVFDSTWLADLRTNEAVHHSAPAHPFPEAQHFVLTFQDSTLEAIADGLAIVARAATMIEAANLMTEMVANEMSRSAISEDRGDGPGNPGRCA
jgi:hypothetical protein